MFVLANPGSGDHDASLTRPLLAKVFQETGRTVEFVEVAGPTDLARASDAAGARARQSAGVLVAVGGDGTINTVAQAAIRHGCALGVIPQGTFNLFARNHGIPTDVEAAARALAQAQAQPVQVGWLNDQLFLVNASLGLYPQLLENREAFQEQMGRHRWVAVLAGLVTLFRWRRKLTLDIDLEDEQVTVRTSTLFVGNNRLQLARIGIGDDVVARVGEGRLAVIVVRPIRTLAMLSLVLRGALGQIGDAGHVGSFAFRSLTVRPRHRRRPRPMKVAADGEVYRMTPPLRFSISPQPLLLMLPRAEDRAPLD